MKIQSTAPSAVADVGGTLFFTADDGVHGWELWKSDGTAAGTDLVKDIRPGGSSSGPTELTTIGGRLFFTADDGVHGRELWRSDGTRAGTVLVRDINAGPANSQDGGYSSYLTNVSGTLFFTADDGVHGDELWKSDGTRAGTVLVKDIIPGARSGIDAFNYPNLRNVAGTLFFTTDPGTDDRTDRQLWKSDGTKAGTVLVKHINPGTGYHAYYYSSSLTGAGGTVFFQNIDDTHGEELWKSDGTKAGTVLVKDINPGPGASLRADYFSSDLFTGVGRRLFFSADDGTHGRELWRSDGTRAGTALVKDIRPGGYPSNPFDLTAVSNRVFFTAADGVHGRELWRSDGTTAGTVRVKDINPRGDDGPSDLTNVDGALFFAANDGVHGRELWRSDGTRAGTALVKDIAPGRDASYPSGLTAVGRQVFFFTDDGTHRTELWKSDGTAAGTVLVKDINVKPR